MTEPSFFIDTGYVVTFVGTTNGVVMVDTFEALRNMLADCYPNPGDPTLAYLLDPANWLTDADGVPYNAELLVGGNEGEEDYRIAVYRVMEVTS